MTRKTTRRSRFTTPTSRARTFKRVEARKAVIRKVAPKIVPTPTPIVETPMVAEGTHVVVDPSGKYLAEETAALNEEPTKKVARARKPVTKRPPVPTESRSLDDLASRIKAQKLAARKARLEAPRTTPNRRAA